MDDDSDEKDDTKRKSRNLSEKKRRDQFNVLINELCSMVSSNNRKMDKSSVLRSTISFLRSHSDISVHSQTSEVQENWKPSFLSNEEFTHLMLEALDGFIIVVSCNGHILYTSESITSLLGYLPDDLNLSVFEIIHDSDKQSLYNLLNCSSSHDSSHVHSKESLLSLMLHIKHGPIHSENTVAYELVHIVGKFCHWKNISDGSNGNFDFDNSSSSSCSHPVGSSELQLCFVAVVRLQTPQLIREMSLLDGSKNEFTSRHSLEWKFLFLDHRAPPIIGYLPFEVLGTSGYDYYHVDDLEKVAACHEALMQTGEGTSCYYRFLTKGQQWIWIKTRYYITYHQWNSKPEFIVCTHSVISYKQVQTSLFKEKSLNKTDNLVKLEHLQAPNASSYLSSKNTTQSPAPSASSRDSVSSGNSEMSSGIQSFPPVSYERRQRLVPQTVPSRDDDKQSDLYNSNSRRNLFPATTVSLCNPSISSTNQISEAQPKMLTITALQPVIGIMGPPLIANNAMSIMQQPGCQTERHHHGQSQLQDYLRRRHQLLQQQILIQQEELRRVSEQLMLVQFVTPNLTTSASGQSSIASINTATTYPSPCVQQVQHLSSPLEHCTETRNESIISKSSMSSSLIKPPSTHIVNQEASVSQSHQIIPPSHEQVQVYAQDMNPNYQSVAQNT